MIGFDSLLCSANDKAEAILVAKILAVDIFFILEQQKVIGKQYGLPIRTKVGQATTSSAPPM